MENDRNGAGVKFPPPVVYLIAIVVGFTLDQYLPLAINQDQTLWIIAIVPLILAMVLAASALLGLRKAKTSIEPWRPTSNIVDTGIFAYSRNPIYLSFICFGLAFALGLNTYWVLIMLLPATLMIKAYVVDKEEQYLATKFGEEYLQYCKKVRRWL